MTEQEIREDERKKIGNTLKLIWNLEENRTTEMNCLIDALLSGKEVEG